MATFTYTAKRALQAGHTAGTDYSVTIDLQQADAAPRAVKKQNTSLNGNTVTVLHRIDEIVRVQTDYYNASTTPSQAAMDEFMHSVAGGETFVYNDGVPHNAILDGDPSISRNGAYFSAAFSMRLLS